MIPKIESPFCNFLKLNLLDFAYAYLDLKERKNLGLTCLEINKLWKENEKYEILAKKIITDFNVPIKFPPNYPLWLSLKSSQIFLIGEDHAKPKHRKIFVNFVNAIWPLSKFSILVEGPSKKTAPIEFGVAIYLKKEIAKTCKGWDLNNEEIGAEFERSYEKILLLSSLFLQMRDEISEDKGLQILDNLICLVKKQIPPSDWNDIPEKYLSQQKELLKIIQKIDSEAKFFYYYKYKNAYVCLFLVHKIKKIIVESLNDVTNILKEHSKERDISMLTNIDREKKQGSRVIVLAGMSHVLENIGHDIVKQLKNRKDSFIVLTPKRISVHSDKSDNFGVKSPREFLKSYESGCVKNYDELYRYIATKPWELIEKEIEHCEKEYDDTEADFNKYWN